MLSSEDILFDKLKEATAVLTKLGFAETPILYAWTSYYKTLNMGRNSTGSTVRHLGTFARKDKKDTHFVMFITGDSTQGRRVEDGWVIEMWADEGDLKRFSTVGEFRYIIDPGVALQNFIDCRECRLAVGCALVPVNRFRHFFQSLNR
jgi:hypothetical protein